MKKYEFYEAWWYLEGHEIFHSCFDLCLVIEVQKVDSAWRVVQDDKRRNTRVEVWLECGGLENGIGTHDPRLDCGGDTFEEAIIELARLVKKYYCF